MKKIALAVMLASACTVANAQTTVLINEVDADTAGTDTLEFIELFDGGVGNTDLSGLSIVLYNGSDDLSYNAFDLDGLSTDANGYFVLGNTALPEADFDIGASNIVQNGADAVVLLTGNAVDFPNDSPQPTSGIIDALVYDTSDSDDSGLLPLINLGQPQINEGANGNKDFESNQRCDAVALNTDSYVTAAPTPGAENTACSAAPAPAPVPTAVFISDIQGTPAEQIGNNFGDTDVSPLSGMFVEIEGIVVGDFQDGDADETRNLRGFYLQEETTDSDNDPLSSEGIFIFEGGDTSTDVSLGDTVRVTGTVDQNFGETQIENVTDITIVNDKRRWRLIANYTSGYRSRIKYSNLIKSRRRTSARS